MSSTPWRRRGLRAGLLTLTLSGVAVAVAGPALAHVRVTPSTASQGSYATLTFRVPTESDTASTVGLSVDLPAATPLAQALLRPLPGWNGSVTTAPLPAPVDVGDLRLTKAPRTVTWTAQPGQGIAPGQFQEFAISVGPLPPTDRLLLPATQTYSDGQVVHWDQPTGPGGAEPEHPAPEVTVTPVAAGTAGTAPAAPTSLVSARSAPGTSRSDPTARALGGAGVAVGAAGLGVGLLSRRRRQA